MTSGTASGGPTPPKSTASNPPRWPRSDVLLSQAARPAPLPGLAARLFLVAVIATAGLVAFLGVRPYQPWILWLTAFLIALATDGTVRSHRHFEPAARFAIVPYVLLPAMAVLGAGYFAEEAFDGYARTAAGVIGGIAVAAVVFGEYHTVDYGSRLYGFMRLVLAIATYLVAFALYTIIFTRDTELALAGFLVGAVSFALSVELLRESRLLGSSSLLVGLAIGVSMAELRLVLYYFPLDGLLAGALLIIGFYLATGLVHHLLDHDLELGTMAEYLLVAGVGTAAVVITRVFV
ncbi:MAG: hypothetical protein U5Q44_10405 [Dehalococcoidia bacterium]|nr:hypothetical protein [Dehalococcoidia bacterium]